MNTLKAIMLCINSNSSFPFSVNSNSKRFITDIWTIIKIKLVKTHFSISINFTISSKVIHNPPFFSLGGLRLFSKIEIFLIPYINFTFFVLPCLQWPPVSWNNHHTSSRPHGSKWFVPQPFFYWISAGWLTGYLKIMKNNKENILYI